MALIVCGLTFEQSCAQRQPSLGSGATMSNSTGIGQALTAEARQLEREVRQHWCSRRTCLCGRRPRFDTLKYRCGCAPMDSG